MDVMRGGELERGRAMLWLAFGLVFVSLMYSVGVLSHRAYAREHGFSDADRVMGEVRSGPSSSWAEHLRQRTSARPAPADPPLPEDGDSYLSAVEGIGVEFRADLEHLIALTKINTAATLRALYGARADIDASVDYMIDVALTEAAATRLPQA